jgi:hypothetical protein
MAHLKALYQAYVAKRWGNRTSNPELFQRAHSDRLRSLSRLERMGINTVPELIVALPTLSPALKFFGIEWVGRFSPSRGETILLRLLRDDPKIRLSCAHHLGMLKRRRSNREFVRIGRNQLASAKPDPRWLESVIGGLKSASDNNSAEVLVEIYERQDLPGWLRGDAGDALGFARAISDRRTRLFRRIWAAAAKGIHEPDIDVQFWSMYVIMQLATNYRRCKGANSLFHTALPRLRDIAETDHRIAPGFWWPMCEEAKDAIECIETGTLQDPDAAERWSGKGEHGEMVKRY